MTSSINRNQPEDNHENLRGDDALAKMRDLVKKSPSCFFCTAIQTHQRIETRPMHVQEIDDAGHLWFMSASDSSQNEQIGRDAAVQLMFQGSSHSDFLTIYGTAKICRDQARIEALWNPLLKTWFTEGKDDPRITLIEVTPTDGYYWDTKHNRVVQLAKMIAGAVTGKTLDDSVQGKLRV